MDPLSICASAVTLTQLAGSLAASLCGLAKTAINAESHVSSLCEEIATLARFLTSVDRALRNGHQLQQQFQSPTSPSLSPISVDDNLWHQSSLALSDCQITLTELGALVSRIKGVVRERKRLWRLRTAVDLKFHASELEACRAKIHKSNFALQMILHAITVSLSLRSNASQDLILLELDRLKSCIDDALQAAVKTSGPGGFSTIVGDQSDARVARHLRDLARAARTFHSAASSTAGSTIRGDGSVAAPWGGGNLHREEPAMSVLGSFTPMARERVNQFVRATIQVRDSESYLIPPDAEPELEVDGFRLSSRDEDPERIAAPTPDPPAPAGTDDHPAPTAPVDWEAEFVGDDELEIPVFEVLEDFATESMKRNDFSKAAGFLRDATRNEGNTTALSPAVLTRLRIRLAVCYLLQRRRRLAEDIVSTLTQQQQNRKLSRPVCNLLHAVALAQLSAYLFDDAITTCKQALQAKRCSLGPKDPDTIESLCLLATAYDMSGNLVYTEATRRLIPPDVVYVHPCDEIGFIFRHEELLPADIAVHITTAPATTPTIDLPAAAELDSGVGVVGYGDLFGPGIPVITKPPLFGVGFADPTAENALRRQDRLEADTSKECLGIQTPRVTRSVSLPALLQDNIPKRRKTRYPTIKIPRMFRSKSELLAQRVASMEITGRPVPPNDDTPERETARLDVGSDLVHAVRKRSPTVLRKARPERSVTTADVSPTAPRIGNGLRGILRWMGPKRGSRSSLRLENEEDNIEYHIRDWIQRTKTSTQTDVATIASAATRGGDDGNEGGNGLTTNRSSWVREEAVDWSSWIRGQELQQHRSPGPGSAQVAELMGVPLMAELPGSSTPYQAYIENRYASQESQPYRPYRPPPPASTTTSLSTNGDARSIFSSAASDSAVTDDSSVQEDVEGCETRSASSSSSSSSYGKKRVHWGKPDSVSPPPPSPSQRDDEGNVKVAFAPSSVPPSAPTTSTWNTSARPRNDGKDTNAMSSISHDSPSPLPKTRNTTRRTHKSSASQPRPIINSNKSVSNLSTSSSLPSSDGLRQRASLPISLRERTPLVSPSDTDAAVGSSVREHKDLHPETLENNTTQIPCVLLRDNDRVEKQKMNSGAEEDLQTTKTEQGKQLVMTRDGDHSRGSDENTGKPQQELRRTMSWIEGDDNAFWKRFAEGRKVVCA